MNRSRVDFSYAFATPHRLTIARPDSGDKTILDVQAGSVRMAWTIDSLTRYPLAIYASPPTTWDFTIKPEIDGKPFGRCDWSRRDGYLPILDNVYTDARGAVRLEIAGTETAALTRITLTNTGDQVHRFTVTCASKEQIGAGYSPAWLGEEDYRDTLLSGWRDRADRILFLALGAPAMEVPAPATLQMVWNLSPGQSAAAWLVRPYRAYKKDIPHLRGRDWNAEFETAVTEWKALLARAVNVAVPDPGVRNGLYACLADLFIMREPVAQGYLAGTAGTECYRAPNNAEPAVQAICLDQFGYHQEAEIGYRMCLDLQGEDGDWADPEGWSHHWWSSSGFKSWAVIEHYKLTRDRAYLEKVFPRMLASSRYHERRRSETRKLVNGERPLTYGLMPRGQGDCGLFDGEDYYGVYYPHNFWAVFADACAAEAARILGRPEQKELEEIYEKARADLLASLAAGAILEEDYRWIPAAPGKTTGSRWGALNALFPCRLLPPDHELITGTIRKMEARMSPGGLPIHTGWQKDGMWVAITLDNLGQALLARGEGDKVAEYLYAVLNHGTPLYSWCEERGQEPGNANCTGDRQHLFTPVAVLRAVRDSFVMEENDGLQLALGAARDWLGSGEPIGIQNAPTHFGPVSWHMQFDPKARKVTGTAVFPDAGSLKWAKLHIRLPGNLKAASLVAPPPSAAIKIEDRPEGTALILNAPRGEIAFEVAME